MRKDIVLGAALACVMSASADTYNYMQFTTADGVTTLSAEGLVITVDDGKLHAVSGTETLEFSLADLISMEFTDNSSVGAIKTEAAGPVTVFSLDGKKAGEFRGIAEAASTLAGGTYIVHKTDGSTVKIMIER